jgi:two-component system CheB/CheR fusion protein
MTSRFHAAHSLAAQTTKAMALRLAQAEDALHTHTSGHVDAILDGDGRTYLLRPAQKHLQESEERLRAIIESAVDVVTVVNRSGTILSQNRAAKLVLGYDAEELVGGRIFEYIHENDLREVHSAFIAVIEGVRDYARVQFRHRAPDGSARTVDTTVCKLRGASTLAVVFTSRAVDNTLPAWSEALAEAVSPAEGALAKDRFLAVLSHELRTPLTPALLGLSELEEDERFLEARPTLALIRRNLELQSTLIEELMNFVAVGQHKLRLDLRFMDAHDAIRSVVGICRSDLESKQIKVVLSLLAARHWVQADSLRLQQVMWNLLKNAVKFSPQGSTLSISTSNSPSGQVAIDFVDQGIGIEPELLPHVFDAFRQAESSKQQHPGGLGLGLFIAKGLAEAQQGALSVASEGLGRGATFRLTLHSEHPSHAPAAILPHASTDRRDAARPIHPDET